ncbi:gamma-interferon-inducible lysosomal thiol reductase isoform X1 [Halyomorpha halys]|uniref:gamma-interferon-inducible lysosomal thiol reductase isoform X1 n=1 Tax=Halyomorpha halys TaxID=286706 RepID=UPI0006D51661|nr:GILT-like protein 1 isoform X1 [Halyomorpha halys]
MAVLFLLAAIVGCALAKPNVTPVSVTLYYESLCPGCREFIPNQLYPAYTDTKYDYSSLISKLTLVPYGWAHVLNATTHEYQCQHGEEECQGNRLHGCALKYIPDALTSVEYLSCLEKTPLVSYEFLAQNSGYPIDKCQEKLPSGIYQKIMSCYNSEEGLKIFEENGKKTTSFFTFPYRFVPYISFNDKADQDLALASVEDFKKTLCKVAGVTDKACAS